MNGHGIFSWKDGRIYEGENVNDKKEGKKICSFLF